MRTCTVCKEEKTLDSFSPNKKGKQGKHSRCKFCQNNLTREIRQRNKDNEEYKVKRVKEVTDYNLKNPDKCKNTKLKTSFGITLSDFNSMLASQNQLCAICKKPEIHMRAGVLRQLNVDHCHETGKVRGLLCNGCNTGLGQFKDNIESLYSAIEYLKKNKG